VNDDFLTDLREEPRPEFASGLEARLREIEAERAATRSPLRRLAPALAGAGVVAMIAFAFTLEPVRAAAQSFLDLFRVKRFAAVPVDPERLAKLAEGGLDFKSLVAEQVQAVTAPQPPQPAGTPEEAGVTAGIAVGVPAVPPNKSELKDLGVAPAAAFRVTVDTAKLQALAEAAGADEIEIPAWWHGVVVDIDVPPVVAMRFTRTIERPDAQPTVLNYQLLQAARPEVELPEGFDVSLLGRLGLRLTGMSAQEALEFASAIDWRATLLVPVPVQGGTYRQVEVNGQPGLLVSYTPPETAAATRRREQALLLWSSDDKVFALSGPGDGRLLLESAASIR
jgi:hypothetical protein